MALVRQMADGTEAPCHKCGEPFNVGDMKIKRPSHKPGLPGVETVGGKGYVWTHEKCAPTRYKRHGTRA